MKFKIGWKSVLSISLLIAVFLIFSVIYADFVILPSDDWSKYVTLHTSDYNESTNNYYDEILDAAPFKDGLLVVSSDHRTLILQSMSQEGNILLTGTYEMDSNANKLSVFIADDSLIILAAHESALSQYVFDSNDFSLISSSVFAESFDQVKLSQNKALYLKDDLFYFYDGNEIMQVLSNDLVEKFDFAINDEMLYVSTLEYDYGSYYYAVHAYDFNSGTADYERLDKLKTISGTISLDVDNLIINDQLYSCLILKNTKYGQNFIDIREVDLKKMQLTASYDSSNMSYDPNNQFSVYDDRVVLLYNDKSFIGKREIGSQFSVFTNVYMKSVENSDSTLSLNKVLTKSQNYAPNFKFVTVGEYHYLVTTEIVNGYNTLYLSSDHPSIIKSSQHISLDDYKDLFFGSLTYIPTSLLTIWSVIIGLIIPVAFVIIPIAIVKMNWVEQNHGRMLNAALIAYLIAKAYYYFSNFDSIYYPSSSIGATPIHLRSIIGIGMTFVFTTFISYLSLHLLRQKIKHLHFTTAFFSFFGFEMVQYMLYIMVYLTMYK